MLKYIVKRILMLIPVLLGATFIVFTVMDMTPGDPAVSKLGVDATAEQIEELRESMGLNDPFLLRYGRFIWNLVQGDLGTSYKNDLDVMEQIMQRMPIYLPVVICCAFVCNHRWNSCGNHFRPSAIHRF